MSNRRDRLRHALMLSVLLSGFCGLVYEVVWMRALSLVFGNALLSTSFILAVFMGGLAIGSYGFGRWATLRARPSTLLRAYALMELGIGLWALALLGSRWWLEPLLIFGHRTLSPALFTTVKAIASAFLLLPPTALMGGTFPVLSAFFGRGRFAQLGREIGRLYAINTFGAAAGSFSSGFLLIPALGLSRTQLLAVALNILVAAIAFGCARTVSIEERHEALLSIGCRPDGVFEGTRQRDVASESSLLHSPSLLLVFFFSGFAALLYEVAYTRVLALLLGPTVYAFGLMLTIFILGLALGSRLLAPWSDRWGERADGRAKLTRLLASLYTLLGLSVTATLPILNRLPLVVSEIVQIHAEHYARLQLIQGAIIAGLLLVPTMLSGAAFPVIVKLYLREERAIGRDTGGALAANTIGAVLGSLLTGLLLIPHLGTERTFWVGILINVGISAGLLLSLSPRASIRLSLVAGLLGLFFLLFALIPRWDVERLSAGLYKYAPYYADVDVEIIAHRGDLLFYKEGALATVAVRRVGEEHQLSLDGKVDASDGGADMFTQKLLAHLPLLLADRPRRACVIGLGSGVTAGAALKHPLERVDIVEISPEVVRAARFFEHVNDRVLDDSRARLILGDGRNHLLLAKESYDVIISEPSNPWMAGMSALFTREFFQLARARLTDRGLLCQWFHSYNMSLRDLQTLLRTFHAVFPRASLWMLNENDLLLIGAKDPTFDLDLTRLEQNFHRATVREDLERLGISDLYAVLSLYVMRDDDLGRFAQGAPLHTDDHPVLEFSSPRAMHAQTSRSNLQALQGFPRALPPPPAIRAILQRATWESFQNKGRMYERAESFSEAFSEYRRAIERYPRAREALEGLLRVARTRELRAEAKALYEQVLKDDPRNLDARLALATWYEEEGRYDQCLAILREDAEKALAPIPRSRAMSARTAAESSRLLERYAACLAGAREVAALEETCQRWLQADPGNGIALFHLAALRFQQGALADALALARRSVEANPQHFQARTLVAMITAEMGETTRARALFEEITRTHSKQAMAYYNYGLFLLNAGQFRDAREQFQKALDRDPLHVESYLGLAEAFWRSGQKREARTWARRVLRWDPHNPLAREILYGRA
ncbi:MAG: fused MFS/spermidine synthase [Blastocatellia bacterium]|nr:fused MFS/spermidine synthase [Blastocatellia bacterium]MCS7156632.1 fused MFS/spermidine synthase [Blastocatellia bacterium]MCX7751626.1 fused MFS/spermidine synthase [Blastocatellia bacterium]MDW8168726.1 fused MFS/spermidine synthase [Acidobacteriota bacterium]MDW8256992.1 fused MFS/spermidine synthase [Acidobacteriota bacterium]